MKMCSHYFLTILILSLLLFGCKKDDEPKYTYEIQKVRHSFLATYKFAADRHDLTVNELRSKANVFAGVQDLQSFADVRTAWIESWDAYQFLRPFSLMSEGLTSPINFDRDRVENVGFNLTFLDETVAQPGVGIVFDDVNYPNINGPSMDQAHDANSANKTTGYQVTEFILWGEDTSIPFGGTRIFSDFDLSTSTGFRRTALLISSTNNLNNEFPDFYSDNFENEVLLASNEDFLSFVFSGVLGFIENVFAQETLLKPYNSQDPDDEVSRFSENTKRDLTSMLKSIERIFIGTEINSEPNAYFFIDLLEEVTPGAKEEILEYIEECKTLVISLQGNFDNAISSPTDRPKILTMYNSLRDIAAIMRDSAPKLGVQL